MTEPANSPRVLEGQRIGPYDVVARLGAGGMGEVYRARDLKVGRDVAIKILPPVFTRDPERLTRFEREARVLAALVRDRSDGCSWGPRAAWAGIDMRRRPTDSGS